MSDGMTLKDTPGGPEFIARCVQAAADVSLAFAGEPTDRIVDHLKQTKSNLRRQLIPMLSKDNARLVANAFVRTVLQRKAEMRRSTERDTRNDYLFRGRQRL